MARNIEIEGLDDLMRKLSEPQRMIGRPLRRFFTKSALSVQRNAKKLAPVDTGRLRSSIETEIDSNSLPLWAKIGTNVNYAMFMEYGTAKQSDSPRGGKSRHFPPPGALDLWARRHGLPSGFVVARAIAKRGGLKPRRYMRDGLQASVPDIQSNLDDLSGDIEKQWQT